MKIRKKIRVLKAAAVSAAISVAMGQGVFAQYDDELALAIERLAEDGITEVHNRATLAELKRILKQSEIDFIVSDCRQFTAEQEAEQNALVSLPDEITGLPDISTSRYGIQSFSSVCNHAAWG